MPPGVPILGILRAVYDSEGRAAEVEDSVAVGDRHTFRFQVGMR
jgi:DNA-binding GntR family transcriptional regulator